MIFKGVLDKATTCRLPALAMQWAKAFYPPAGDATAHSVALREVSRAILGRCNARPDVFWRLSNVPMHVFARQIGIKGVSPEALFRRGQLALLLQHASRHPAQVLRPPLWPVICGRHQPRGQVAR